MVKTKIIETTEDDEKGNTTLLDGNKWLGRPTPNIEPFCEGNESIKITY